MTTRKTNKRLEQKRNAIIAEFKEMTEKRHLQVAYVISILAQKYFYSEITILNIVKRTGYYK